MKSVSDAFTFDTGGNGTIVDLSEPLSGFISRSGVSDGLVNVFVPGSTGAVTTTEYEPGLVQDIPEFFEKIIPSDRSYHHDLTWGDANGFSHLRASLLGPSLTVPLSKGQLVLGTWQQVIFLEFDNRPRRRRVVFTVIGE
ncbi:YjbQ family protein [bacterium]|nr:MAG: YjbQ family protein [bacterium]